MGPVPIAVLFVTPQLLLAVAALLAKGKGHYLSTRTYALHAVTALAASALAIPGAVLFTAVHPMLGWACAMAPVAVGCGVAARVLDRGSGDVFRAMPLITLVAIVIATGAAIGYRIALFQPSEAVRLPNLPGPLHARWACAVVAAAFEFNAFALWWAVRRRNVLVNRRPLYVAVASALFGAATFAMLARMYDAPMFLKGGPPAPVIAPLGFLPAQAARGATREV